VILCDTGPLVAAFNAADRDHSRCAEFLRANWSRLVIPSLPVTEVCHLLADPQRRGRPGLAAEFCAAIAEDELRVIEATPHDYRRMAELLNTYASLRLQVVDSCVIALAERLDVREVASLDRRDFLVAPGICPKGNGSPYYQATDSAFDDERLAGRPFQSWVSLQGRHCCPAGD
jgi:predicted nucleic acid-binding protein